jgi:heterodisulfide reductase subunit A-like polyferredoxin
MDAGMVVDDDLTMAALGNIGIVGEGIAGLTLAAALDQQGIQAELVEQPQNRV